MFRTSAHSVQDKFHCTTKYVEDPRKTAYTRAPNILQLVLHTWYDHPTPPFSPRKRREGRLHALARCSLFMMRRVKTCRIVSCRRVNLTRVREGTWWRWMMLAAGGATIRWIAGYKRQSARFTMMMIMMLMMMALDGRAEVATVAVKIITTRFHAVYGVSS